MRPAEQSGGEKGGQGERDRSLHKIHWLRGVDRSGRELKSVKETFRFQALKGGEWRVRAAIVITFAVAAWWVGEAFGEGLSQGLAKFEFSKPEMGTTFVLSLYSDSEANARRAAELAFKRVEELNQALSDYDAESELSRLCERAGGPAVPVSQPLFDCLERSKEVWRLSQGAFDVTAAPVIRLWRRARRTKTLPDPKQLEAAQALVGSEHLILDREKRTVRLAKKGMRLDLGGIAKGYAADQAYDVLKREGHPIALIAAGGDIRAGDPPPGREGWEVAIAGLKPETDAPVTTLLVARGAVSTAGDAYQFVEIGGKRYSHIIDPRTGQALTRLSSVSVVAPDATTSDSLDTAASVMGPEPGIAWIESLREFQVGAIFLTPETDGPSPKVREIVTKRFADWPKAPSRLPSGARPNRQNP